MDNFETGRIIGRLDIILEDVEDAQKEIDMLDEAFKYEFDLREISRIYGRLEQKMIRNKKNRDEILELRKIFEEIKDEYIESYLDNNIEELNLFGVPIKKLNDSGIYIIRDLYNKTYKELLEVNGISESTVKRIVSKLSYNCIKIRKK